MAQPPLVLVVDDDPVNRRVARHLLARMGCDTCEAEDGLAAVEVCRRRQVDLVLMDVVMPVMDGHDATVFLRATGILHDRHIPIIGLSARTGAEDRRAAREAGMDEYLAKPLDVHALSRLLQRLLPGRTRALSGGEAAPG